MAATDSSEVVATARPDWVNDKERPTCTRCTKKFTQIRRRHHWFVAFLFFSFRALFFSTSDINHRIHIVCLFVCFLVFWLFFCCFFFLLSLSSSRVCGDVFCGDCCYAKLSIPELGYSGKTRVCEGCKEIYTRGGGINELQAKLG